MKSICIKTNNSHILDYLQKELNVIELNNICFTCNEFKNYKKGRDVNRNIKSLFGI